MQMSKKVSLAIAAVIIAGGIGALIANNAGNNGGNNGGDGDSGGDFSGGVSTAVACEEIAATRLAVADELADRKSKAAETLGIAMEKASDDYWETRRGLDTTKTACETEALLADPCKDLFEQISSLANQILGDLDNGFDEAKFQEREGLKEKYDECLKNPPEEDTYPGKLEQCRTAFDTANQAALDARAAAEKAAQDTHDATVKAAEAAHTSKMAALDALEKECEETKYERKYGSIPGTGIPVTDYQGGSSACTGVFPGSDPDTQRAISRLRSQYEQAKAAGKMEGFGGALSIDAKIQELENEMAGGDAKCTTDADCGGPEPVCCNISEIGRAFCSDGICSNEKTACGAEEVCAGKPAQCLALVQVIEYQGSLLPIPPVHASEADTREDGGGCPKTHWHGDATSLKGEKVKDPDRDGCGYDPVEDRPSFKVYPPSQQ